MPKEPIEKIFLCSGEPEVSLTAKAVLFGHMVKCAAKDGLSSYLSDLFHDALWIEKNVNAPGIFYWAVRDSGTHIGLDVDFVLTAAREMSAVVYRIELTKEARLDSWHGIFTRLSFAEAEALAGADS